ncbi:MAG: hypothetical protein OQL28_06285 [Sedimenticola sp.]|nr:hypothetical protein [Sedimenticola sp.]
MNTRVFQYRFDMEQAGQAEIDVVLDSETLDRVGVRIDNPPDWTALEVHQCPHCPLKPQQHPHCPVAIGLVDIIRHFDHLVSYDRVDLTVVTEQRTISQRTTAQHAISSLIGLVMATSGCPHTAFFKPMARFHLPLASEESTIYRAAAMYLLAQFFRKRKGVAADPGLSGLRKIYENLHLVNMHIAKRLKDATRTDSSVNAVVLLDSFTSTLPYVIEEHLDEIAYLFSAYHSEEYEQILAAISPDTE